MKPTILYNPNNGITMPYEPALAGMAPNLVALTDAEYRKIVAGKSVQTAKKETAVADAAKAEKEAANPAPGDSATRHTIDTVPDSELLDFVKSQGLDFQEYYDMADESEKPQALAYIRRKASAAIKKMAAAKLKG